MRLGRRGLALVAVAAAVVASFVASAHGAGSATVRVWFLQGEQLVAVDRPGVTAQDAVTQLLAGPTPAEVRRGVRTYVPAGTLLRSVAVENGLATVDLGLAFVRGRDPDSLRARLAQLVRTASGVEGSTRRSTGRSAG